MVSLTIDLKLDETGPCMVKREVSLYVLNKKTYTYSPIRIRSFWKGICRFALRSPLRVLRHYSYGVKSIRCHRTCRAASIRTEHLKWRIETSRKQNYTTTDDVSTPSIRVRCGRRITKSPYHLCNLRYTPSCNQQHRPYELVLMFLTAVYPQHCDMGVHCVHWIIFYPMI